MSASSVALLGNPNTGKTTLFNRLCGARAKTSNFPGTTTAMRVGRSQVGSDSIEVIDLPGLYSLQGESPEAAIVRGVLRGAADSRPSAVIALVDASNLFRNLVLVGELLTFDEPVVVALNMVDIAERTGLRLDVPTLSRRLGVPVVPMVASKGIGLDGLRTIIASLATGATARVRPPDLPPSGATLEQFTAWTDDVLNDAYPGGAPAAALDARTERIDRVLTHPLSGTLVFLAVMGALFWTLFELATVPMDLIELTFGYLGAGVSSVLPAGAIRDLLIDGVIGGIAGTVVFLPQICLLFFMISLLEDTGYLARAAFVNDRIFRRFGLPGQAFVPLLTAHACALPAIMSTRLIPDRRDRLATIMVAPFMSCSARLPVYILLTGLLFADRPALAGLAFAGCYLLGSAAAFFSAWLFGKTALKGTPRPMVLELPSYKRPSFTNALLTARDQGQAFLQTAGTVIVAICVVMWWLSAYPKVDAPVEAVELRQAAETAAAPAVADELRTRADVIQAKAEQSGSFAGIMGRTIQPVFQPLGYDWQLTVGVLTSFLAREVFVSTMSVIVGGGAEAEPDEGVRRRIRTMTRDDGSLVFTRATAASALIFFVLAMQCLPTLAVTRKETGKAKYAVVQLAYMSGLAYVTALVVYQSMRAMGIS
ncbi:MAG: ferrous iron transporter B [Acidobacteria bacterium]|jgi:ferrous iron transport protein B|nr:ferrous iron transporter B [Acidobacteriota bacterium]